MFTNKHSVPTVCRIHPGNTGDWDNHRLTVGKPLAADGRYVPKTDISVPIRWTRPLPWAGRGYKHAERFRVLLLLDLSTPENSYALCGIWANSKSFLLAGSRRADRVGQQAKQRTASTGM